MKLIDKLAYAMTEYDNSDARRIQHFIKVHSFARLIGTGEGLSEEEMFTLEAAALVHDIGIKKAEEIYGRCDGRLQERLGPDEAERLLKKLGFDEAAIRRVCYLVGHHHTYGHIDGADYRILVEADFLVNLYEDNASAETVQSAYEKIFKTESGRYFCREMFGVGQ